MKVTLRLSIALLLLMGMTPVSAITSGLVHEKNLYELIVEHLSVSELQEMGIVQIEKRIGNELTFKEKVGISRAKRKIIKLKARGFSDAEISAKMSPSDFEFRFLPFLLGFFLSIVGLLIAFIIWGRSGLLYSAYGAIVSFLVGLIYGYRVWWRR